MDNPISGVVVSVIGGILILSAAFAHWDSLWIMAGAMLVASGLLWSAETLQSQLTITISGERRQKQDLPWWLG